MGSFPPFGAENPKQLLGVLERRKGMSGRIFTDEEREAAKHYRREARQRLADKAYYSRV
jgi:hypothetical protein